MAKSRRAPPSGASSRKRTYCPCEGDVIQLDFDPQAGSEQRGRRPALVLSPAKYNSLTRLCVVCPLTNQVKGYPFEVPIPVNEHGITGVVLSDQIKCLSWTERNAQYLGRAPNGVCADVKAKLDALLSISPTRSRPRT